MVVLPSLLSFEQTLQKTCVTTCDGALRLNTNAQPPRLTPDPRKKGARATQGLYVQTAQ
jgi:hypothetical protein